MISDEELLKRACSFDATPASLNEPSLRWLVESRGKSGWAITKGAVCLNKSGEWEYEPMPSHRTDAFIKHTRWATPQEAFAFLEKYCQTAKPVV